MARIKYTGKKVQKVQLVKKKRRKRGPKVSKGLLKNKLVVNMRYCDTISITPGAAAINSHYFSANGIYDPDVTGTGHQPLLHDEYSGLYGAYRVLKSKIKVTPITDSGSTATPSLIGVFVDQDTTLGYSTSTQAIEDKNRTGSYKLYTGIQTALYNSRTGGPMTRTFNAKRHLGPEGYNNVVAFGGNPNANTVDARYFCIWAGSVLGNTPSAVELLVEIDYVVELTSPLTVTES